LDFQQEQETFLFSETSSLALGPTQRFIQWVWGGGALSLGIRRRGLGTDSSPLVLRAQMGGAVLVLTTYLHGADWGNFTLISCTDIDVNQIDISVGIMVLCCVLASVSHQDR